MDLDPVIDVVAKEIVYKVFVHLNTCTRYGIRLH